MTQTATTATATYNQKSSNTSDYETVANRKIDLITAGLHPFIYKDLTQNVSSGNAVEIAEYILAMKAETNLSDTYRKLTIQTLSLLSRFIRNKSFIHMTREEVIFYLDSLRRSDVIDPLDKWIGTYNLKNLLQVALFSRRGAEEKEITGSYGENFLQFIALIIYLQKQ